MPRTYKTTSRQPRVTENEIALQWEIRRLRAELKAIHARIAAEGPQGVLGKDLEPVEAGFVLIKMERITRRTVRSHVKEPDRCKTCGGVSWYQFERAMYAEAARYTYTEDNTGPNEWRAPDEQPRPGYDDEREPAA